MQNTLRKSGLENPENHRDTEFTEFLKVFLCVLSGETPGIFSSSLL